MEELLSPTGRREIQYYTELEELIIPEYGRNIQNLIKHATTIEDREKRQLIAEGILNMMTQVSELKKNPKELQQKLWNHIMKISNYELDVDIPEDVIIVKEDLHSAVEPLEYPPNKMSYKHYGRLIQQLIDKAKTMPEGEMRDEFITILGAYMKMAFKNWHKNRNITDDVIYKDFEKLSQGILTLPEEADLNYLINAPLKRQTKILKTSLPKSKKKRKRKRKPSNAPGQNKKGKTRY